MVTMNDRYWTTKDIAELRQMALAGMTNGQIGERFGICKAAVSKRIKAFVPEVAAERKATQMRDRIDAMISRSDAGASYGHLMDLVRAYGVDGPEGQPEAIGVWKAPGTDAPKKITSIAITRSITGSHF